MQSLFIWPTLLHMKLLPLNSCLTSLDDSTCLGSSTFSIIFGSLDLSNKSIGSTPLDDSILLWSFSLGLGVSTTRSSSFPPSVFLVDFSIRYPRPFL